MSLAIYSTSTITSKKKNFARNPKVKKTEKSDFLGKKPIDRITILKINNFGETQTLKPHHPLSIPDYSWNSMLSGTCAILHVFSLLGKFWSHSISPRQSCWCPIRWGVLSQALPNCGLRLDKQKDWGTSEWVNVGGGAQPPPRGSPQATFEHGRVSGECACYVVRLCFGLLSVLFLSGVCFVICGFVRYSTNG